MEQHNQKTPVKHLEVAKMLNQSVAQVIGAEKVLGFEKAFMLSSAVQALKDMLTPEYMKPIMALQNNRLGFKTDSKEGYNESVVKNCLIEAVLTGVQPFGNQFNIISSNMYITKEGFGYLLSNLSGLSYEIVPELPRINGQSAAVVMNIKWIYGGVKREQKLDIPIRVNAMMGADAVIGKATRKARAWLYNTVTGSEVADGDITDVEGKVVQSTINSKTAQEIEAERVAHLIEDSKSADDLMKIKEYVQPSQMDLFNEKLKSFQ